MRELRRRKVRFPLIVSDNSKIRRLEELSGAKVAILSTGPEREQTIYLDDPFAD